MKLRTKLLLGVGILLLAMVIAMYLLPTYLVHKDIYKAADQIHGLLIEDQNQLVKSQQLWLEDALGGIVQNINSILFMLYEEGVYLSKLVFTKDNPAVNVWDGIARMAGYDPQIGFIQAHSPEEKKTAVVSPHATDFYPVSHYHKGGELDLFAIRLPDKTTEIYTGIPMPKELQTEAGYTLYAVVALKHAAFETKEVEEEIAKITPGLIEQHLEKSKQILFNQVEGKESAYYWAIKIDMIRDLTPLFVEGLKINPESAKFTPDGIARVDSSGSGVAILTNDVFQTAPFFDDSLHYETHPPKPGMPPLAQGSVLVTRKEGDHVFIGNTLLYKNTFLTIGVPLRNLLQELALSSNKTIVLQVKNDFWIGFDGLGNKLSTTQIEAIVKAGVFESKQGKVNLDGKPFYYDRLLSIENGDLVFYELHSTGREQSIISTLFTLEDNLTSRITLQLSLISVATMILILLFIWRMGLGVIRPITKLALATEQVAAGHYEEVVIPDLGKRRDEVAVLSNAFKDMVHGIQDKERIRGVLDKVVSKDVADEILRTQIHLGGEDRIVTMLFSDIRGFTELTEKETPQNTIHMLNACMTKISRVIEGEGGVIDKYVGDEVMAIFGAPTLHSDHALRAVSSGMLMIETLKHWNEERVKEGQPPIEMGIGVNTGLVVAGNMGAEDRLNYTVLGANVNLAARLCQVANANQLIISEATLNEPDIRESFYVKLLEPIELKGFKEPVSVYEVTGFKWEES